MSYRQDKKVKQKRFRRISIFIVIIAFLFYFQTSLGVFLSRANQRVFGPVVVFGNNIGHNLNTIFSSFRFKKTLQTENQILKQDLLEANARMANYDSLYEENIKLKEILGRKDSGTVVLAGILARPNQSPYDTLIIDAGIREGIEVGNDVFAMGDVPIGRVAETYEMSAKVLLYSTPGEKTQVFITGADSSIELVGRGGGNFEVLLNRDFVIQQGIQVVLPGVSSYLVAVVEKVISDPRDSYQKVLLTSPVNIQNIKFVQVKK